MASSAARTRNIAMLCVLYCTAFIAAFNENIINVALVDIMGAFSVTQTTAQWLVTGYMIVTAIVTVMMAFLQTRFSSRRLFFVAMAVLIIGEGACMVAPTWPLLLFFRLVQAIASGICAPLMNTAILALAPRERMGTYMAIGGAMIALGPALGPVVSGVLVTCLGWKSIFAFPAIVCLILLLCGVKLVFNFTEVQRAKIDAPSVALVSLALTLFVYGVGAVTSALVPALVAIVVALVAFIVFVRRQGRLDAPLLDLRPMRSANFWPATIMQVLAMIETFSMSVLLPLYYESVFEVTAMLAGLLLLPPIIINAALTAVAGRIYDRHGEWPLIPIGFVLMVVGQALIAVFGARMQIVPVALFSTLVFSGVGLAMSVTMTGALRTLPPDQKPHGISILSTLIMVAAAIGPSVLIGLLSSVSLGQQAAGATLAVGQAQGFSAAVMLACGFAVAGLVVSTIWSLRMRKIPFTVPQGEEGAAPTLDQVMKADAWCVNERASVRDVARVLVERRTSGVPVVDSQRRVVGFISDGDIMRGLSRQDRTAVDLSYYVGAYRDDRGFAERVKETLDASVMDVCTTQVECVEADTPLDEVCAVLAAKRYKKLPVTREGKLVGTVSRSDIVRHVMSGMVEG